MIIIKSIFLTFLSLLLINCASAYGPVGDYGGFEHGGYEDKMIDANTSIVSYRGNGESLGTIKTYLLYRCAEVTINNGYDYFIVTNSTTAAFNLAIHERNSSYSTNPPSPHYNHYTHKNIGSYRYYKKSGTPLNYPADPRQLHGSVIVIKMYQGQVPPHMPNAYDAKDVIAHLGPATMQ